MNAVVLQLPAKVQRAARRRQNRVEVDARHSWMMKHRDEWGNEATGGVDYPEPRVQRLMDLMCERDPDRWPRLTMARMRRDIAEGRKEIEKRNRVKAWVASLGVDMTNIKDAEEALFAAFDKLA